MNARTSRRIATAGGILLTLLIALLVVYRFAPGAALAGIYRLYEFRAGVSREAAQLDGYTVPYYRGGAGPVIVLLHGFGDSKVSFVQAAGYFTDRYDVILPDFPGFGETEQRPERNYSIAAQRETLRALLDSLKVERVILAGNSMGGHIAASFTLAYPDRVEKLILLNAAGLRLDDPLPYKPAEKALQNEEEFDAMIKGTFFTTPWVPRPFKLRFIEESQRNFAWLNRVKEDIRGGEDYILNDRIRAIKAPTLIIWGDYDTVVRPLHAPVWRDSIAGSKMIMLKNVGHAPQYEDPARTAALIREFIEARN